MVKRSGKRAVLEQLKADGIRYIFGNPGTVEEGFLDILNEYPDIEYILGLQETIPIAIADAYARNTKKPAIVQLHSGVGLGNGIGMMYQAMRGHSPLVVIVGDAGIKFDAMDAQMAADLVAMAEPVTKWSAKVSDSKSVLRMLRRAIKIASTPPMGPVFLCLPLDVLDEPNDEIVTATSKLVTRVQPGKSDISDFADMLMQAARPMVIIGDGVSFSGAQQEIASVSELLGAEVWGADSSEVNIDATHPQYMGLMGHMFGKNSSSIVADSDAVLIVGSYVFPEVFPALQQVFSNQCRVAHIDLNAYEIAKNFPVDFGIVADPKLTLQLLIQELNSAVTEEYRNSALVRQTDIKERKKILCQQEIEKDRASWNVQPMGAAPFMQALAEKAGHDTIIFDEALTSSPALNRYLPGKTPGSFYQTRGGSLGVGIPGAIGLKLAQPSKTVVGFSGDGGSMYTIQALWTAARYQIGAKFVICNNHSYRLLKLNIQEYWRERNIPEHEFPSCFDLAEPAVDFVSLSKSLSVPAIRVLKENDISEVISEMLSTEGPFLVELVINSGDPIESTTKCGQ